MNITEASRGAAAQGVTVKPTGCGFDPHSKRWNIYLNLYFHFFALVSRWSAALSAVTQHAMPPDFGRKWGKECLNTRSPLPTLLCAGYSVKLIYLFIYGFIYEAGLFGRKWGTECLNTRFPLTTLLCAGYSVKLIYLFIFYYINKCPQKEIFSYILHVQTAINYILI